MALGLWLGTELEPELTDLTLRGVLRAHTAQSHEELDRAVGHFADRTSYGHFTNHSYRFRQAVEAAMAHDASGWQVDQLAPTIALDLADLGLPVPPQVRYPEPITTPAQRLGTAYVLEGSSLGARLLIREAQKLGFDAQSGARHLAHQAGDHDRWRRFMAELDTTTATPDDVIAAAEATFRFALSIYSKAVHERA